MSSLTPIQRGILEFLKALQFDGVPRVEEEQAGGTETYERYFGVPHAFLLAAFRGLSPKLCQERFGVTALTQQELRRPLSKLLGDDLIRSWVERSFDPPVVAFKRPLDNGVVRSTVESLPDKPWVRTWVVSVTLPGGGREVVSEHPLEPPRDVFPLVPTIPEDDSSGETCEAELRFGEVRNGIVVPLKEDELPPAIPVPGEFVRSEPFFTITEFGRTALARVKAAEAISAPLMRLQNALAPNLSLPDLSVRIPQPLQPGFHAEFKQPLEPLWRGKRGIGDQLEEIAGLLRQQADQTQANASAGRDVQVDRGSFVFARYGMGYLVAGFGEHGVVRRLRGFDHIAALINSPAQPIAMVVLVADAVDKRITGVGLSRQPAIDSEAIGRAKKKNSEIEADLDSARKRNDEAEVGRLERAREELVDSLSASVGLAGKVRDLNDPSENFRPRIHGALKRAYAKLRAAAPPMRALADHFERNISSESGTFVYNPASPPPWSFLPPTAEKKPL